MFAKSLIEDADQYSSLNYMKGISSHEQDSGVLLLDKSIHLTGLLAACKLLDPKNKAQTQYSNEVFWLGLATVNKTFAFSDSNYKAGAIGILSTYQIHKARVCSTQAFHIDENDQPAWFSGSVFDEFQGYMVEPGVWTTISDVDWCLESTGDFKVFDDACLYRMEQMRRVYMRSVQDVKNGRHRHSKRKKRRRV